MPALAPEMESDESDLVSYVLQLMNPVFPTLIDSAWKSYNHHPREHELEGYIMLTTKADILAIIKRSSKVLMLIYCAYYMLSLTSGID